MAKDVNGWAWGKQSSAKTNEYVIDREQRAREDREWSKAIEDAKIRAAVAKNNYKHWHRQFSESEHVVNTCRFVAWAKAGCETLQIKRPATPLEQWDIDEKSIPDGFPPGIDGKKYVAEYLASKGMGYDLDDDK